MTVDLDKIQHMIWDDCQQNPKPRVNGQCGWCGGTGCLGVNAPVGHPAFGKAFRCICTRNSMTRASVQAMLELEANMTPEEAQRYDFKDFDGWHGYEEVLHYARAIAAGEAPADGDGVVKPGLLMSGTNGIGKTTLAAIVFRYWAGRGENVIWQDYTRLIKRVQATYNDNYDGPSEDEIMRAVQGASLLVLDDVGAVVQAESRTPRAIVNTWQGGK